MQSNNVVYESGERLAVSLQRPDSFTTWGFRLQGGVDFSTPLSVQHVNPNSLAERFGLQSGDGIERINDQTCDTLTHEDAKKEIVRSGNKIDFIIVRGAVRIWRPQVTPMNDMKQSDLGTIHTATGDQFVPVQKTSLADPKPQQDSHIGSSHNRAARPFAAGGSTPKQASATVVHSQFNSPIGLYSANNIAQTYETQTQGITDQVQSLDLSERGVGTRISGGTYQPINQSGDHQPDDLPASNDLSNTQHVIHTNTTTNTHTDINTTDQSHTINFTSDHINTDTSRPNSDHCNGTSTYKVSESFGNGSAPVGQSRSFYKVESELSQQDTASSGGGGPGGFRSVKAPEARPPGQPSNKPSLSRCNACDMLITGVFVKGAGQPYHVACLKCVSCGMNLKQKGYIVVEGRLYCDIHAKRAAQAPGSNMVAVPTFQ